MSEAARRIVLHYHLFKNAGTSVDRALKAHFKEGWATHEGDTVRWPSHAVARHLVDRPEIVVLSSHTASLPVPKIAGAQVFPVIFLRHPIDRVRSMYEFEVKQGGATEASRMAERTDLKGYVRWRLDRRGDRAFKNFQTLRFAFGTFETGREADRALATVEALPFVGLVERYEASMDRLTDYLAPAFPGFRGVVTKANTTQREGESLQDRLDRMKAQLGEDLYARLVSENRHDMNLYAAAEARFGASATVAA